MAIRYKGERGLNRNDLRRETSVIVKRGNEFLVGFSVFLRWSNCAFDAWRTRDVEAARLVANRVGGELMLFNPVVGQIRKMKGAEKHGNA